MKIPALLVCAALAVPFAAVAQSNMPPSKSPQISVQAQHFLTVLASEDQSEIDLAHLALKKSNNPQVQQYAKSKILAADPSMKQGAQQLGQKEDAPVAGFPPSSGKAEYYYLSKLSGKAFDKAYMNYEDAKQNFDLIVVAAEAKEAKNPQVKAFAQKEETPVRQAAQSAKQIAQSMGA